MRRLFALTAALFALSTLSGLASLAIAEEQAAEPDAWKRYVPPEDLVEPDYRAPATEEPEFDEFGLAPPDGSEELTLPDEYLDPRWPEPERPAEAEREREGPFTEPDPQEEGLEELEREDAAGVTPPEELQWFGLLPREAPDVPADLIDEPLDDAPEPDPLEDSDGYDEDYNDPVEW